MNWEITFLNAEHRVRDGKLWDMVDYVFRVSNGKSTQVVAVGITGQFHDPAEAMGAKKLSREELVKAAEDWLRSRLDKGECDPFRRPETDASIDLPSSVMDYWTEHHSIPHWL